MIAGCKVGAKFFEHIFNCVDIVPSQEEASCLSQIFLKMLYSCVYNIDALTPAVIECKFLEIFLL